jgi:hypothetical protein
MRETGNLAPMPARITPHTFRRTFITLSFQAGQDLVFVQSQAGHADWKTTLAIYTQQSGAASSPLSEASSRSSSARQTDPRGRRTTPSRASTRDRTVVDDELAYLQTRAIPTHDGSLPRGSADGVRERQARV